ncbi:MAG TPA: hypothetical protein VMT17_11175 [Anaeromyxobacteraceae bacterium]|nr:hypothetical protein [Anaeromyxobacteraceae bacterium]
MTVSNASGSYATANSVTANSLTVTPDGSGAAATLSSGPTASGSTTLAAGGSVTFTWVYVNSGTAAGTVTFSFAGNVAGTAVDANTTSSFNYSATGGSVSVQKVSSLAKTTADPSGPAVLVASDPFGDGSPSASLFAYRGAAWVGPSGDGTKLAQLDASGAAAPALFAVAIGVDAGASPASNLAWLSGSQAATFGASGCAPGSTACGPDNEAGAFATAGTFGGGEELFAGGTGPSGSRYLYATSGATSPLAFAWEDLRTALPGTVEALSAALAVPGSPDRLYLGYGAGGGPQLLAVLSGPSPGGLDAVVGTDVLDLAAGSLPGVTGATAVTALVNLQGVLYVALDGGLVRAMVPVPGSASGSPGDWALATPSTAEWGAKAPVAFPASGAAAPRDRAVPALASFGLCGSGPCVYAIRNVQGTATQPAAVAQLWRCAPSAGPYECAPGDWSLAAANAAGDTLITQLGDETNGAAAVLAATPQWLYLGLENASTGFQLYRASVAPQGIGDFVGLNGCVAGTAGCQGVGGNGFGNRAATRIFDARALTVGGVTSLWMVVGDGSGPMSVYKVSD